MYVSMIYPQYYDIVVRQKSIFNDSSARIGALTETIANVRIPYLFAAIRTQDISSLTTKVDQFSNSGRMNANPQMRLYAESLVQTLRQRLAEIVKGLQEVSELRVRILQEQESRRNKFSFAPSIASQVASGGGAYAPVNTDDPELGGALASTQAMSSYQTSRLTSVQGIQRTIAELGQIFSRMANTIQQQEEMVSRIDSDVDAADFHIKEGTNQLMIYYNSISSNRKLILKIFAILILFAIIMAVTA
jgi:syntaxin 5